MRKIMVLKHVGHEPLGTLNPMLKKAGFRIRYLNFGRHPDATAELDGYRGLIILGGPMGVYEADLYSHLKFEMQMIERALSLDIPILGICLGSQLLAHVLGAKVEKGPTKELGWHELHLTEEGKKDSLFAHYQPTEKVFQLHQDTFSLPKDAIHLASSNLYTGQAFRYGKIVYGLQFHLEVDKAMIHRWLKRDDNLEMIASTHGLTSAEKIHHDTEALITRSLELSHQTFEKFIEIFQLPDRPLLFGSGR